MAKKKAPQKQRYKINTVFIKYPDKASHAKIMSVGGDVSKLSKTARESLNITRGEMGDRCDDMLPVHLEHYLADGRVVAVSAPRKKEGK